MNAKAYYQAIDEYQRLISQKQFNDYFLDKERLSEVKGTLDRTLKNLIRNTAVELVEFERKAKKRGIKLDSSVKHQQLEERLNHFKILREKILSEEPLEEKDYETTYREPKFIAGLTFPQTCFCVLAGIVFYLAYKFAVA